MAIGVSLWFDPELEARVREVWRELAEAGIDSSLFDGRYRPHITLGIWNIASLAELEGALSEWVADRRSIDVEFRSVGLFPEGNGITFLQPVFSSALLALQRDCHALVSRLGPSASPYFQPDGWVPHCTCAWDVPRGQILSAASIILDGTLPLKGSGVAIGMIDTPAEVELSRFELNPSPESPP